MNSIDLQALNIFVKSPVSQDMIHKLVVATLQVLPCQEDKVGGGSSGSGSSSGSAAATAASKQKQLPSLMTFLTKLVRYTNVYTGTLMATLVYLHRLKNKLPKNAQGLPCTRHRILLSCLILSSKYHNDCSPKNVHWAKYTDGLFTVKDINLMERQLSFLLNWDLKVSNDEMVMHLGKFLTPIKEDLIKSAKMRKFLQKQQQHRIQQQQQQQQQQTQTQSHMCLSAPSISRSSSTSSSLSLHYRQDSSSSLSTESSLPELSPAAVNITQKPAHENFVMFSNDVDPLIELTALKEERGLNEMIQKLIPNSMN